MKKSYFIIEGYPMPPQSNHLYANKRAGGRRRSEKYNMYRNFVYNWEFLNRQKVIRLQAFVKECIKEPLSLVRIHTYFGFIEKKVITKARRFQKMDASNRIKACHDTLAEVIGIDDLRFTVGEVDKVIAPEDGVFIVIEPAKLRTLRDVQKLWPK